jgi:hypothetical protein
LIEVPVKDEDEEDVSLELHRSGSGLGSISESDSNVVRMKTDSRSDDVAGEISNSSMLRMAAAGTEGRDKQLAQRGKRPRRESARRVISYDDTYTNDDLDGLSGNEEEVTSTQRLSRRRVVLDEDDDEDELMIGAEVGSVMLHPCVRVLTSRNASFRMIDRKSMAGNV